ncbi:glycosyltransferase [uncultured Parabacteroides sp.]|uniref:glycosyltransferase n=1 Tax=uncultured Parabacteroides sp. TaxID=512312 RepID=UPI002634F664|nr:glycosyltransferase [uncultured Parabacteroides sp.]
MKRIVFINAHCNHLLMNTWWYYTFGIKAPAKYQFLFRKLLERDDVEVVNLLTPKGCVYPRDFHSKKPMWRVWRECKSVLRKNGLQGKMLCTDNIKDIRLDDVALLFVHCPGSADRITELPCYRVVHLNQYQCHNIEELDETLPYADRFMLEADVFKEGNYINLVKPTKTREIQIVPYIVGDRFQNRKAFADRRNKAVATGTIASFAVDNDYSAHYGTRYLHKMRVEIYNHKEELETYIDAFVSPYIENKKMLSVPKSTPKLFRKIVSLINLLLYKPGGQKSYFSFDIVEKYNDYMMAVVPEEIVGIAPIGAFEAMACGCALIGIDHTMYTDLGLVPGTHYITYDGTIEGLKKSIAYYQEHTAELEEIACKGCEFAHEHFNKERITEMFYRKLSL